MKTNLLKVENLFVALADKTRLRLLNLVKDGEISVQDLTEALQELQPKVSRHLAYLRRTKIVEAKRAGKLIYYKLSVSEDKNQQRVLAEVLNWVASDSQMQRDRERLFEIYSRLQSTPTTVKNALTEPQKQKVSFLADEQNQPHKQELADFLL